MATRLTALRSTIGKAPGLVRAATLGERWRDDGMSAHARGYGYRWRLARGAYLRQHPACVMCQAEGRMVSATVVDHIIPHEGDQVAFWDATNWQALCAHHHSSHKQKQEGQGNQ